ncbi:hypothetical protein [Modestobacter marinus]|uniref:hypothetical protein n=1 Tax=Modestobacter marinus TaxID=477641 RepID=UPI001C958118|nr:hypothetical protein [Modestobacter marinus]
MCDIEAEPYRRGTCARCALHGDLTAMLVKPATDRATMLRLVEALCASDRPESIFAWLRPEPARELLTRLATGAIPMTHEGLDAEGESRRVEHLRSLLEHHGLLPKRDHHLALFDRWLAAKLSTVQEPEIRQPVERFATWHHLRRIRAIARASRPTRGPVHWSKQEISETIKFLSWLKDTHGRHLPECVQADVDEWLAAGPTTRHAIRTFFVWAKKARLCSGISIDFRQPMSERQLTQADRLSWLRECLVNESETLPYRVAGALLLLYAQPVVRIAGLRTSDVVVTPDGLRLTLGIEPVDVPEPFATLLRQHLTNRPNLRTGNHGDSPWLFPSTRAGRHLHPNSLMDRLRDLGISLLGARNAALRGLVAEVPAPLVAEMLGYSYQVMDKHAAATATPYARYVALPSRRSAPRQIEKTRRQVGSEG